MKNYSLTTQLNGSLRELTARYKSGEITLDHLTRAALTERGIPLEHKRYAAGAVEAAVWDTYNVHNKKSEVHHERPTIVPMLPERHTWPRSVPAVPHP